MRNRSIALIAVFLAAAGLALAQESRSLERIHLRFNTPARVMSYLLQDSSLKSSKSVKPEQYTKLVPAGVSELYSSDADNSIVVAGTADAVRDTRELIRLLDVKPKQVRMDFRIVRILVEPSGKHEEVIGQPSIITANNEVAKISFRGGSADFDLSVTPRANSDRSVTLSGGFSAAKDAQGFAPSIRFARRIQTKRGTKRSFLGGMTDSQNQTVKAAVERGQTPADDTAYSVYLIYVVPLIK